MFDDFAPDGLMLSCEGVHCLPDGRSKVTLCGECHSALTWGKIPWFSLKNNLYRGHLPDEFKDLNWVEEMVCSCYHNTAHVTRLYGSSDPMQPSLFHGNTCAHNMNIISIADTLPRTPTDVNGMISVAFVSARKLDLKTLGSLFHICKAKVRAFLCWLSVNNCKWTGNSSQYIIHCLAAM
jgi:Domain of unknown function (DUF6570)